MGSSYYDVAMICLNGHVINSSFKDYPESNAKFCGDCGEKTVTVCGDCGIEIRGYYNVPGLYSGHSYEAPNYCHECGHAYPWTQQAIEAAKELALEIEGLTDDEREQLNKSIDELVKNGPKTVVATTKFKKLAPKFGPGIGNAFRDILIDVLSEGVKKSLWP